MWGFSIPPRGSRHFVLGANGEEIAINVIGLTFDNKKFLDGKLSLAPNESKIIEATFPENSYGTILATSESSGFVLSNKVVRPGEYVLEFLGQD